MGEKIGQVSMEHVERARKERRFIYTDWKTGAIMLSDVSQGGGKRLPESEIEARKKHNANVKKDKLEIRLKISSMKKDRIKAAKQGDAEEVARLTDKIATLEMDSLSKKRKIIPRR